VKIKKSEIILSILFIITFLIACTNTNDAQIKDEITTGSSTSAGNPGYDEPEPLPPPNGHKFLVTSTDNENNAIVFATGGLESSYKLLISNQTLSTIFSDNNTTLLSRILNQFELIYNILGLNNSAHAESNDCPTESELYICLTVNEDGSIDPTPLPNFTNEDTIYYAYYDPVTEKISDQITEHVNTKVHYTTLDIEGTYSLSEDTDGNIVAISYETDEEGNTTTRLIKLKYDEGFFKSVSGDFDTNYSLEEISSQSFQGVYFNSSQAKFQLAGDDAVHSYAATGCEESATTECSFAADTTFASTSHSLCSSGTCSFSMMKNKADRSFFSTEHTSATESAYIIDLYGDSSTSLNFINNDSGTGFTPINADDGTDVTTLDMLSTLAFDVFYDGSDTTYDEALVLYKDSSGNTRINGLYTSSRDSINPAVTKEFSTLSEAIDLVIYSKAPEEDSSSETEETGKAAILVADSSSPSVQFLNYDLVISECTEDMVAEEECDTEFYDGVSMALDTDNSISLSYTPISWAFNTDKSIAYVLSETDITVVDTTNRTTLDTLTISSAFGSDKEITTTPKSIIFSNNHLLVGTNGIGSILIFDVSEYEE